MTWFATPRGYELFFNRDERRTRKPALPPATRLHGDTRFVAPLDGDFGGTWLAANQFGVTLALENGYTDLDDLEHEPPEGFTSRGQLPIALIDSRSAEEALTRLSGEGLHRFRSFLLAAFDAQGARLLASWIRGELEIARDIDRLMPIVSSSFETAEVRTSRRELFGRMKRERDDDPAELHLAYHASHSPRRGPRSTCMHRPDARTVSFSRISVDEREIRFFYAPHSPCRGLPRDDPVVLTRAISTAKRSVPGRGGSPGRSSTIR